MTAQNGLYKNDVVIASGEATSTLVATSGGVLAGFYAPASMTGASVSFTAASTDDPTTFYPVRDAFGNLVTVTLNAAASYYSTRSILPFGPDFIRIVSASNEAAGRTIKTVFQAVV